MTGTFGLADRNVLVTGATGFIGSAVAETLAVREGATVTGTGRKLGRARRLAERGVRLLEADLLDAAALEAAVAGQEFVIHAAAVLGGDPETAHLANAEGTGRLARLAAAAGVRRFVHVSTVGVYDTRGLRLVQEDAPLAMGHAATYPRTKALAEERLLAAVADTPMEVAVVRPSMVYGPGYSVWTVRMFRSVCEGDPVFLGDGSAHFHPVFIDDVVDALLRCATSPQAAGEAFNISQGVTTWRYFMRHYGRLCGREPKGMPVWLARLMALANRVPGIRTPVDSGFIEMATSRHSFPYEKAQRMLGWKPRVGLEEGMERTAAWLRERGMLQNGGLSITRD